MRSIRRLVSMIAVIMSVCWATRSQAQAATSDATLQLLADANKKKMLDAPESPVVQAFNDRVWMLKADMHYTIGHSGLTITIPKGFVTDFASVPREFWIFIPPIGSYSRAAVVHDWLYWTQACTRVESDNLLFLAMSESDVSAGTRYTIYTAVRSTFGQRAWDGDAREKRNGYVHVLIPPYDVVQGNTAWSDYRERLHAQQVQEPAGPTDTRFCVEGDRTVVF